VVQGLTIQKASRALSWTGSPREGRRSTHHYPAMSRLTEAFIMSAQGPFCVQLVWTGRMLSMFLSHFSCYTSNPFNQRVKEKLRSGEMIISGDQWPVFLYHGYNYDPQDPWNGLFRSALLVAVRFVLIFRYPHHNHAHRHSNTSSLRPVLLIKNQKPLAQEMLAYMA
jgi:hypothetical protein